MATPDPDRRHGDDWSLRALYDLVPDAYELDLLEESRRPPAPEAVAPVLDPVHETEDVDAPVPSVTQAQFLVERVLGGEVVDDPAR